MRHFLSALTFLACVPLLVAQDQQTEIAADIERYLKAAQEGSAVVRPQAAKRLVRIGQPALPRLLEVSEGGPEVLGRLGASLVAVLPDFGDATLRARVWEAFDDSDFPWRPAAALALARTADAAETERLAAFVTDRIALVRTSGLEALDVLTLEAHEPLVRGALADPDDRVRRRAAQLLDKWGHHEALWWLVEDMRRDDHFFDAPTGRMARYATKRVLDKCFEEKLGLDAKAKPDDPLVAATLGRLEAMVSQLTKKSPPELPAVARAFDADLAEVLGLEVRSCRRGEYYLRFDATDSLWVGSGHPREVPLAKGTSAELLEAAGAAIAKQGEGKSFFGQAGCDAEMYYWRPDGSGKTRTLHVSKGPDAVEGLRPAALGELAQIIVDAIPEGALREDVRAALLAVGGELE